MHPDWTWSNVTPNHTSTRQLPNRCKRIDSCSTTSHSPIRRDSSSLLSSSRCRTLQLPAFVPSSLSGRPRLVFKLLSPSIWGPYPRIQRSSSIAGFHLHDTPVEIHPLIHSPQSHLHQTPQLPVAHSCTSILTPFTWTSDLEAKANMSLARAFTTRRVKQSLQAADSPVDAIPQRSHTTKGSIGHSIRHKISAPVELVHTTNMLSYNAPDIVRKAASPTTASSVRSDDDSDSAHTAASTPPTSPDSPYPTKRSMSPEPNHLSCYFTAPGQTVTATSPKAEAPAIPQRSPSHTKKSYDALNRHRSVSRLSEQSSRTLSTKASFSFSRSSSSSTSTSVTSHNSVSSHHAPKMSSSAVLAPPPVIAPAAAPSQKEMPPSHPFGHELAQVTELAEEYGVMEKVHVIDEEEQELARRGLRKFSAEDYLGEIQGLFSSFFAEARPLAPPVWI